MLQMRLPVVLLNHLIYLHLNLSKVWLDIDMSRSNPCSSVLEEILGYMEEQDDTDMAKSGPPSLPNGFSSLYDSFV